MIEKEKDLTELFEDVLLEDNVPKMYTKLPYVIWIDPAGSEREVPHDKRRLKIVDPNNSANRVSVKIDEYDPVILAGSFENKNTDIKPAFEFIKKYYNNLMDIFDGKITIRKFVEKLK